MAGELRIYAAKGAVHGATTIASATHVGIRSTSVKGIDPGAAGAPGMVEEVVTDRSVEVTVFAMDPSELQSLCEAAAANLVVTVVGQGAADKTITIKNIQFNDPPGPIDAPRRDAGGKVPSVGITARGQWGAVDTWATMITYA